MKKSAAARQCGAVGVSDMVNEGSALFKSGPL